MLLITEFALHPPTTGGRQRTNLLERALARIADVDVFWINGDQPITDPDEMRVIKDRYRIIAAVDPQEPSDVGIWRLLRRLNPAVANRLVNFARPADRFLSVRSKMRDALRNSCKIADYDVIVGRYLHALVRCDVLHEGVSCVVDVDDFDTESLQTHLNDGSVSFLHGIMDRRALYTLRSRESRLLAACSAVWVTKSVDLARITGTAATVLPNIPFVPEGAPDPTALPMPPATDHVVMTVGSLTHVPNVHGIDSFLRGPWQRIRERVPQATFHIVGSGLRESERCRWQAVDGVRVIGFVDDLRAAYGRASITLCNVHWGAGSNIKVVESLAYGRTSVVTEKALRGWEAFRHGDSLCVARSDDELVEFVTLLLLNDGYRTQLAERGRQIVGAHFSMSTFARIVESTVLSVTAAEASPQR